MVQAICYKKETSRQNQHEKPAEEISSQNWQLKPA
jgi:hypothetical protein